MASIKTAVCRDPGAPLLSHVLSQSPQQVSECLLSLLSRALMWTKSSRHSACLPSMALRRSCRHLETLQCPHLPGAMPHAVHSPSRAQPGALLLAAPQPAASEPRGGKCTHPTHPHPLGPQPLRVGGTQPAFCPHQAPLSYGPTSHLLLLTCFLLPVAYFLEPPSRKMLQEVSVSVSN